MLNNNGLLKISQNKLLTSNNKAYNCCCGDVQCLPNDFPDTVDVIIEGHSFCTHREEYQIACQSTVIDGFVIPEASPDPNGRHTLEKVAVRFVGVGNVDYIASYMSRDLILDFEYSDTTENFYDPDFPRRSQFRWAPSIQLACINGQFVILGDGPASPFPTGFSVADSYNFCLFDLNFTEGDGVTYLQTDGYGLGTAYDPFGMQSFTAGYHLPNVTYSMYDYRVGLSYLLGENATTLYNTPPFCGIANIGDAISPDLEIFQSTDCRGQMYHPVGPDAEDFNIRYWRWDLYSANGPLSQYSISILDRFDNCECIAEQDVGGRASIGGSYRCEV